MIQKLNLKNPFVQQYIFEILLPLVGYFFFDWSLPIIAVFYLMDQVGSVFSLFRKITITSKFSGEKFHIHITLSILATFLSVFCGSLILYYFFLGKQELFSGNLNEELFAFIVSEGWILFPVVILMYYMKDQMTFVMPRRFSSFPVKKYVQLHLIHELLIVALIGVFVLIFSGVEIIFPWILLLIFLVLKLTVDFIFNKQKKF